MHGLDGLISGLLLMAVFVILIALVGLRMGLQFDTSWLLSAMGL